MEPGEIEPPSFKFEFKEGLELNWRHIIDNISITDLLSGQNFDDFLASHLNLAYADHVYDPGKPIYKLILFSYYFDGRHRCTKSNHNYLVGAIISTLRKTVQC